MQLEVEIRGSLSEEEYQMLYNFLEKNAKKVGESDELVIFYNENKTLGLKGDVLRIKKSNAHERLILKKEIADSNEEIEVELKEGQYVDMIRILHAFGFENASIAPSFRKDFRMGHITITLKNKCIIGPHYEIDTIVNSQEKISDARKELMQLAFELNLKVWGDDEYNTHKDACWRDIMPVKIIEKLDEISRGKVL